MELGDRLKEYEKRSETNISADEHLIIRIDGHKFSKFTKGLKKPFDDIFREVMVKTTEDLHERFNACSSYTQSDEITLFISTTEDKMQGQNRPHQFNGRTQKIASLAGSYAAICFNKHLSHLVTEYKSIFVRDDKINVFRKTRKEEWDYYTVLASKCNLAYFDARAFGVPDISEVANGFIWRSRDCIKNSKATFAQAYCSHKELQNMNSEEQIQYTLEKYNQDWNTIEDKYKFGYLIKKELYTKDIDIHAGEQETCVRSRLNRLSIPMNTYSQELVDLIAVKSV